MANLMLFLEMEIKIYQITVFFKFPVRRRGVNIIDYTLRKKLYQNHYITLPYTLISLYFFYHYIYRPDSSPAPVPLIPIVRMSVYEWAILFKYIKNFTYLKLLVYLFLSLPRNFYGVEIPYYSKKYDIFKFRSIGQEKPEPGQVPLAQTCKM